MFILAVVEYKVFPVDNLGIVYLHLSQQKLLTAFPYNPIDTSTNTIHFDYDMKDIRGQEKAKRA